MTTIVESDRDLAARLLESAASSIVLGSVELLTRHLEHRPEEYAVVLGPSVPLARAVSVAEALRITRPALGIILVRDVVDTTVLADALRSGMREVVPLEDRTGLTLAIQRVHVLHSAMMASTPNVTPVGGKIITVFSAKGGVGKTTIATNLAVALAAGGSREVCIVDLDLSFGDVAIALQMFPDRTIADAIPMETHLDLDGLEPLLTEYSHGVYALAAPAQPDVKDSITADLVSKILRILRQRFAFVVVDTAPAFDEQVLQAFDESSLIVLIATPDIPALKNLKVACETLALLNIPRESLRMVLNRSDSRVGLTPDEVAASLHMSICASIPSSRDVSATTNRGELLFRSDPRHPVSQNIGVLAQNILTSLTPTALAALPAAADGAAEPIADRSKTSPRRAGLFGRWAGSR